MRALTAKQAKVIAFLLDGKSIVDSAKESDVNESTVRRWFQLPDFQQAYDEARKRMLNHSITGLQLRFDKAVSTLNRHLDSAKTIPRDQIKAAEVVVDKTIQTAKLAERITELEAQVAQQEQDLIYKVTFDLRLLSKEERDTLERIDAQVDRRIAKDA